jgi:hypothetical protein
MRDEIIIPEHFPDLKEEGVIAANKRRDIYSQGRDKQALEFNEAIITRMHATQRNQIKCEKCGKEFLAGITEKDVTKCPDCR